jgi:hypothetical protein
MSPKLSRSAGIASGVEYLLVVILIAAAGWSAFADAAQPASVSPGTWLVLPGSIETTISPALHFSPGKTPLLLIVACLAMLRVQERRSATAFVVRGGRLALLPLAACAILTTDLVVLVIIWILLEGVLAGVCLRSSSDASGPEAERRSSPLGILRLSTACLVVGVLVGVSRYHTTDLLQLARSAAADERVDAAQVVAGLSACLAGAAVIRCGLFPGILWLRQYYASAERPELSDILLVTVLPGFALVTHLGAITTTVPDGGMLIAGLGGLTVIVAAAIAATQKSMNLVVPLLSVCVVALACAGSLVTEPDHGGVVMRSLLIQIPILATVLLLSSESASDAAGQNSTKFKLSGMCHTFGIGVLISGLAGPNAILHLLRAEALTSPEILTLGLPRERVCNVVWAACVFGQWLFAFALIRGVMRQRHAAAHIEESSPMTSVRVGVTVVLTLGVIAAASLLPMNGETLAAQRSDASLFFGSFLTFGAATPAALLGAVVAWLLYRSPESRESTQPVRRLESLCRLSGNWFYLEHLWRFCVTGPTRVVSILATAIDRHLISSGREEAWRFSASGLSDGIEHLRRRGSVYYGLSIMLVIAGLLLVLR